MSRDSHPSDTDEARHLLCPRCDRPTMKRVERRGFLQKKIYPMFGYYPWECALCRRIRLFKDRGGRRYRRRQEHPSQSHVSQI